MTYAELLNILQTLSPDELNQEVSLMDCDEDIQGVDAFESISWRNTSGRRWFILH